MVRTAGTALIATAMIGLGVFAGVRAFVGASARRPANPGPTISAPRRAQITVLSPSGIALIGPDGLGLTRVAAQAPTGQAGTLVPLGWSPDGARLLVRDLRDDTIAVMNADGTGLNYLAGGVDASWSPDGRVILVNGGHGYIYLMNPDGSNYSQLTFGSSASWAPDGKRVLVVITTEPPNNGIYVGPPRLGQAHATQLNRDAGDGITDGSAAWSPNGQGVAFATYSDAKGWRLYDVNPDGSGLKYLAAGTEPAWAPDGSRIAFTMPSRAGSTSIFVIGADGSGLTRLTSDSGPHGRPSWSPDGSKIAYFGGHGDREGIHVMNPDGSGQMFLGSFPDTAPGVVWRITGG